MLISVDEMERTVKEKVSSALDIRHYLLNDEISAETKFALIRNRAPPTGFKFPAKEYKDKRRFSGISKRYCQSNWFDEFDYISYSKSEDGLYCTACVLFYSKTQRQQPEVLVSKPYRNWKDFRSDIRSHSITTSHRTAKARMDAFISTYGKPS